MLDAEPGRGIALRVEVDDHDPVAVEGERHREVDGARGLADAALLVGHREDAPPGRTRHGDGARRVQDPDRALRLAGERQVVFERIALLGNLAAVVLLGVSGVGLGGATARCGWCLRFCFT